MRTIQAIVQKRNFLIREGREILFELKYKSWFSSKAAVEYKGNLYEIQAKNIWRTKIEVYKNGIDAGDMRHNKKSMITVRIDDEYNQEHLFFLKGRGLWEYRFELYSKTEELILAMFPKLSWGSGKYDYRIEVADDYQEGAYDFNELLIYCIYAANLHMKKQGAA